ncbi:MAG: hypothetical protein AB7F43_09105 [Bacteriovoracia bacterium]
MHNTNISDFFNKRLIRTIEKIQRTLGLASSDFSDLLIMSPEDYLLCRKGQKDFTIQNLAALAQNLDINPELLFSGGLDFQTLAKSYFGKMPSMPERYCDPSHFLSRTRAIQTILSYTDLYCSKDYSLRILGKLQLKPIHFQVPEVFISPYVGADLLKTLSHDGFGETHIQAMGLMTSSLIRRTAFGQALAKLETPRKLYEYLFDEMVENFDHTFEYKLLYSSDSEIRVESRPRESSCSIFATHIVGNKEMCFFKQGVAASFLKLAGSDLMEIFESECLYEDKGANRCVYHIRWPAPRFRQYN